MIVNRPEITSLAPLSTLQAVGGTLTLSSLSALTAVDLPNLTTVGGEVEIRNNPQLSNLAGLAALTSVAENSGPYANFPPLAIHDNASLPACWTWQLEAQTGLNCQQWSSPTHADCRGNTGQGSCGSLPEGFACVSGATGPGVYDGDVEIDNWSNNSWLLDELGGVTCITGSVSLYGLPWITTLPAFSTLQAIGGSLDLSWTSLTDLDELANLTTIGDSLAIRGNPQLASLAGLANLTNFHQNAGAPLPDAAVPLEITYNSSLPGCWVWALEAQTGFDCVQSGYPSSGPCSGNTGQGSCGELPEGFACVPGAIGPGVYDDDLTISPYDSSTALLAELGGVRCITGTVEIANVPDLTSLAPLSTLQQIGGSLELSVLPALTNVNGLENLTSIGDSLKIDYNQQLANLAGLANLTSLHQTPGSPSPGGDPWPLQINLNPNLSGCWVWQLEAQTGVDCLHYSYPSAVACRGNGGQSSCGELPEGFECVQGATGPGVYDGDIFISPYSDNAWLLSELGGLNCVTGTVSIEGLDITSMATFSGVEAIGGSLELRYLNSLTSLDELENLTSIAGTLDISGNPELASLDALSNLTSIDPNGVRTRTPTRR